MGLSRDYRARSKPVPSRPGLPASRAKQTHQHDATLARSDVTGDGGLKRGSARSRPDWLDRGGPGVITVGPNAWRIRRLGRTVRQTRAEPMKNERRTSTDIRRHDGFPAQTDPFRPFIGGRSRSIFTIMPIETIFFTWHDVISKLTPPMRKIRGPQLSEKRS